MVDERRSTWRRRARNAAVAAAAVMAAGASLLSSAGNAASVVPPATLFRCAAHWNRAQLGPGRRSAAAAAVHGAGAVVFMFSDGVCGLAITKHAAQASGSDPVYVQELDGTYAWGRDPILGGSPGAPSWAKAGLEHLAETYVNVRISVRTGLLIPDPKQGIPVAQVPEASTKAKRAPCPEVADPANGITYRVIDRTATCAVTREIIWAYDDQQIAKSSLGTLAGWRCSSITPTASSAAEVVCAQRRGRIEAQRLMVGAGRDPASSPSRIPIWVAASLPSTVTHRVRSVRARFA
jgi:hypothetical protein